MMLRRPLRRTLASAFLRSGALVLHRRLRERGRAALLLYHRVNDEADPFFPALPVGQFRAQLDHLARSYRVEPLEDVLDWLANGAPGPTRVAITFDDGYPDTLECALPELASRGLPATLLLSTAPCETGEPVWTERTRWLFKHTRVPALELPALELPSLPLESTAERLHALDLVRGRLKQVGAGTLARAVDELERRLAVSEPGPGVLSWEDVRRLVAGGVRIGAHTHRHLIVSRLDDAQLRQEITTSVRLIEERLGTGVTVFAYPNGLAGDYDHRPAALLRELGVRCSLTAHEGLARPGDDPYRLPRVLTAGDFLPSFAARVAGLRAGWP